MYAYLTNLQNIDPYVDTNCQKLADYLQGGLNYAIAQYDLGDEAATITGGTIGPIDSTITYTLDTTKNLKPGLYCGFPGQIGALQVVSIDSPTTATFLNVSLDPYSLLLTPYSLLTKLVAVRDTRSYDAIDTDLSCYPLLKVFRQKERADNSGVVDVDLVIGYAMAFTDVDKLPGIMHWIARHIDAMLGYWSQVDNSCPFQILPKDEKWTIEYRIMVDNLQNPVYTYLRITLTAREFN
jgi:hypothetical protein